MDSADGISRAIWDARRERFGLCSSRLRGIDGVLMVCQSDAGHDGPHSNGGTTWMDMLAASNAPGVAAIGAVQEQIEVVAKDMYDKAERIATGRDPNAPKRWSQEKVAEKNQWRLWAAEHLLTGVRDAEIAKAAHADMTSRPIWEILGPRYWTEFAGGTEVAEDRQPARCEMIDHSEDPVFCEELATSLVWGYSGTTGRWRRHELCGRHGRRVADRVAGILGAA